MIPTGELAAVALLTLTVAALSTLLAALAGIPIGALLALGRFRGHRLARVFVYTLYGFPPVVAGLAVFMLLRSEGPLGGLRLLFTPSAMVVAEFLLVLPLVTGLTLTALLAVPRATRELIRASGASPWQERRALLAEARTGVTAAVMVGFGRALAEVGAALIVGGNIRYETRTLGTAVIQETREGNFEFAIALGLLLLLVSFFTYWGLSRFATRAGGAAA